MSIDDKIKNWDFQAVIDDKVKDIMILKNNASISSYEPQGSLETFLGSGISGILFSIWSFNFGSFLSVKPAYIQDHIGKKYSLINDNYSKNYPGSSLLGFLLGSLGTFYGDLLAGLYISIEFTGTPFVYFGMKIFTNTLGYFYYSNKEKLHQLQQQLRNNTAKQLSEK